MRDLVTRATGYVGSRLVTALRKAGHRVLAATRNPRRLTDYGWHADVYPVLLDVARPADVPAVLTAAGPIDVLYYLIHNIGQSGYRAADNAAIAAVAAAARSTGAPRIIYPGGFRPHGPDLGTLSEHPAGRADVADALSVAGGVDQVCLGAAMILGAGSTSFEMLRYVGDRFPPFPKPGWMDNPIDPISIGRAVLPGGRRRYRRRAGRCLRHPRSRAHAAHGASHLAIGGGHSPPDSRCHPTGLDTLINLTPRGSTA